MLGKILCKSKKMKIIEIKIKNPKFKKINEIEDFQKSLKTITQEDLQKLKNNIVQNGFIAPIFIWGCKILDGHHRVKAIKELLEEGYTLKHEDKTIINELPIIEINAKNKKEAAKYVLSYTSQYAQLHQKNLYGFMNDFELIDLDIQYLNLPDITFNIDKINMPSFEKEKPIQTQTTPKKDKNYIIMFEYENKETIESIINHLKKYDDDQNLALLKIIKKNI